MLAPGLNLLLHADAILHRVKLSASAEGISESANSDRGLGFDVGAGVAFPVAPRISIVPRVRYRRYHFGFDALEEGAEGSANYFAAGLGLRFRL